MKLFLILTIACSLLLPAATAQSNLFVKSDDLTYQIGEIVKITGIASSENILLQIKDPSGNTVLLRTISSDGNFSYDFNLRDDFILGKYAITVNGLINDIQNNPKKYIKWSDILKAWRGKE